MTTLEAALRQLQHSQTLVVTGTGRRAAAKALAASWICCSPCEGTLAACGTCASCVVAATHRHPDVSWLPPQPPGLDDLEALEAWRTTEPVVEGRQHRMGLVPWVIGRLSLAPRGPGRGHRVLWLDGWDQQGDGAPQQALLKVAEEPAEDLLVVATVDTMSRLPVTWRSRAVAVRHDDPAAVTPGAAETQALVEAFWAARDEGRRWSGCLQQIGHRPTHSPLGAILPELMERIGQAHDATPQQRGQAIRRLGQVETLMRQQLHPQLLAHQVLEALAPVTLSESRGPERPGQSPPDAA